MALREEIEHSGNWLFRWRGYLPLVVISMFLFAMVDYEYPGNSKQFDHIWEVFCLLVSFFGLAIRILTVGHTPSGTSGRNTRTQVADVLNITGMYSVVRNPLYLGNFFMGLGIALFEHHWWVTFLYISLFWLYYERIILAEESFLREKFGNRFLDWAEKTPVFIPDLHQYQKPDLPFSLKKILRREYNGFFAVVIVMFIFETVGDYFVEGKFDPDFSWIVFLTTSFIMWLTLRTMKRYTSILQEEGR